VKECRFETLGPGRYLVTGELGFDTVPSIWQQSRSELGGSDTAQIDLGQVTNVDSAGLALVIEWIGWARERGKRLVLLNLPDKLLALARISDLDELLVAGA